MSCCHSRDRAACTVSEDAYVAEFDDVEAAMQFVKDNTSPSWPLWRRLLLPQRGFPTYAADGCMYSGDGTRVYVHAPPDLARVMCVGISLFDKVGGLCASDELLAVAVHCGPSPWPKRHPGYTYFDVYCRRTYKRLFTFYNACCEQRHDGRISMCFLPGTKQLAIACRCIKSVIVASLEGAPVRRIGGGVLENPVGVACTRAGEIWVADARRLVVFNAEGKVLKTIAAGCNNVAVHGTTAFVMRDGTLEIHESL